MTAEHFAQHQLLASFGLLLIFWLLATWSNETRKLMKSRGHDLRTIEVIDTALHLVWSAALLFVIICIFYTLYLWGVE